MTAPKTFGQIAWEVDIDPRAIQWDKAHQEEREYWERIGAAIALECSRICIELAWEHMRKALGGDTSGASDHRQQAAIECAEAIREAISRSGKETT